VLAVEVKDLWWRYEGSKDWILQGINLTVEEGRCLGIVGPTGAGKTTLLRCLNGLIPHSYIGQLKGEVSIFGRSAPNSKVADMATMVGTIFEDAEAQFVATTLEEDVAFGLENLSLPKAEMRERVSWALRLVGLTGFEKRNAHELSGGQKQRAALASILAMRPKVLLLDEPSAELDPLGKREIFDSVKTLKDELKTTIVLVEQDTEELLHVVDEVILVKAGQVSLRSDTNSFFSRTQELEREGVRPLDTALVLSALGEGGTDLAVDSASRRLVERVKARQSSG